MDRNRRIVSWLVAGLVAVAGAAPAQDRGPADDLFDLFKEGRVEEMVQQGKALLATGTETAPVNLAVGQGLATLDRCAEAEIFLRRAVELDAADKSWVYAWANIHLGACAILDGRDDDARRAWTAARDAGATRNATRNASGNLAAFALDARCDDWPSFRTEHFQFRFSDRLGDLDRAAFARRRDQAYEVISAWFGGGPDRPIRMVVWADQDEATSFGMPALGFSKPEYYLVETLANQTVGHEMTHVISYHALHPVVRTGLINEGVAVYLDQTGRDRVAMAREALAGARSAAGGTLPPISLRALWDDWSLLDAGVSYPVAGAWVERLVQKGGRERFLAYFTDQTREHARAVYGADLEDWIDGFEHEIGL